MMPHTHRNQFTLVRTILILILFFEMICASGVLAYAQADAPQNSRPNPYRTIENSAKLPEGRSWGAAAGVSVDRRNNIWVAERCGANTCAGSNLAPILEFDPSGKLLKSFGEGMFLFPHGLTVDKDGNIWVTDGHGADGKGHQVFKFSPDGKVLMTGQGRNRWGWPGHVQYAVRCGNRSKWRYFCRGRTRRKQQQSHREIYERR